MMTTFRIERICLLLTAGLLALATPGMAQLLNGGFELAGAAAGSATNWTVTQAVGGPVYAVRTNNNPHSGSYHFEVRLASTGAGPVVEFTQAVPVTGGTNYPFSFYAAAVSGSAGYNAQWRVLWNSGGDTGFQNFSPGNNAYSFISNSVTSPPSATTANIFFHFAGAAIPSQSATIQIDDVIFGGATSYGNTNVVRTILSIVPATGIRWFASNNIVYQIQWASALLGTNTVWNSLGSSILGNSATNTVFDPVGPPHNYFRVLSIQ